MKKLAILCVLRCLWLFIHAHSWMKISISPAETADQFHKLYAPKSFDHPFGRPRDADQALFGFGSDGEDQAASDRQLIDEGFGASGAAAATRIARNGANSFQPYVPSKHLTVTL